MQTTFQHLQGAEFVMAENGPTQKKQDVGRLLLDSARPEPSGHLGEGRGGFAILCLFYN
jgi:hypothetical protein